MKKPVSLLSFLFLAIILSLSSCNNEPLTSIESHDGVSISFDNEGKGEPALILIPGWSNPRTIFDAQVTKFSEKYQVIAVDLPGFGESGNNRSDWSMKAYGKDIASIIEQLELDEVIVLGFSMGAPVSIEAALAAPEQVIGVVLVDDLHQVEIQIPPPMAYFMDSIMMDLVTNPSKEKLLAMGFFMHNVDESFERASKFLVGASQIGWRESLTEYMNWQNEHCTASIEAVDVPIIAINSAIQPTNVEAFRKYAPTFQAKIVKDVGHVIMWDNTEEFNKLLEESIQDFISKDE